MNFLFKLLTFIYSIKSFFQRKVFVKNIQKDDLVLDVGSGDKPFWRADVIADKYLIDNMQRRSGSVLMDKKKLFFKADVEKLPFKDKVFDFVFCSHLLEHVKNPDKAIDELTRVGKRGYIEVPRASLDMLKPFASHLWFCEKDGNTLIFKEKSKQGDFHVKTIEKFGNLFFDLPLFQYLLAFNSRFIFICLYWKDQVDYKVEKTKPYSKYRYKKGKVEEKELFQKIAFYLYKIFYTIMTSRFFYKQKKITKEQLLK